jgi:hypothetical protein
VRIDGDRDGQWTPAIGYAERMMEASEGDFVALLDGLKDYDEAVSAQAAKLCHLAGQSLMSTESMVALSRAEEKVRRGFGNYLEAWRECEMAHSQREWAP